VLRQRCCIHPPGCCALVACIYRASAPSTLYSPRSASHPPSISVLIPFVASLLWLPAVAAMEDGAFCFCCGHVLVVKSALFCSWCGTSLSSLKRKVPPVIKGHAKAKRIRWTEAEKEFICSWVARNKPTEGKLWDWRKCVADGKDILSACHADNVKVKDQARTLRLLE
jgi:hypothetical protein